MDIAVIGCDGRIGSRIVELPRERGSVAMSASPTGVDTPTGEGVVDTLQRVEVVVQVTNSPSFGDDGVSTFLQTSTRNQIAAERAARFQRHVALPVTGRARLPHSGYLRAKDAAEALIKQGEIAYSVLRSTQFFEFSGRSSSHS